MFWIFVLAAIIYITFRWLKGEDLSGYDWPQGKSFDKGDGPSEGHAAVVDMLRTGLGAVRSAGGRRGRIARLRDYLDSISDGQNIEASISSVCAAGIPAEWVIAPGADTTRRALYLHGGGFIMGSPKSHRNITSNFSRVANAAVLAIDYRLMPENSRGAGIEDSRRAYNWLLSNGPEGLGAADKIYIAGDSAGGNLTLSLTGWLRTQSLRSPDAAVALSPLTDGTLVSPSMEENLGSDPMLGPAFGGLTRVPRPLLWWGSLLFSRFSPSNPAISPVFGDLSGLPPTLVQASEAEMLLDDARRYVNKAAAAGSPVELQTWPHVVHVWQIFQPDLPEAQEAWREIGAFISANS